MTRHSRIPPRSERPPLPDFVPVPRRYRHDGWTPERQKAFVETLADTGCVDRAARMVNIAQTNCYELRRAPGAEQFRRAWDAALDFGVKRLKDIAFQRAIEGQLVPVFVAGGHGRSCGATRGGDSAYQTGRRERRYEVCWVDHPSRSNAECNMQTYSEWAITWSDGRVDYDAAESQRRQAEMVARGYTARGHRMIVNEW